MNPLKSHYPLVALKKSLVACSVSPQALHREVSGDISAACYLQYHFVVKVQAKGSRQLWSPNVKESLGLHRYSSPNH